MTNKRITFDDGNVELNYDYLNKIDINTLKEWVHELKQEPLEKDEIISFIKKDIDLCDFEEVVELKLTVEQTNQFYIKYNNWIDDNLDLIYN